MATTPQDVTEAAERSAQRAAGEGSPASLDALHPHGRVRRSSTRSRIIVRGEGSYVYDEHGKRYLDGLSALFCVNAGHGRAEMGEAAARQVGEARLLHQLELRPPHGHRAGRADRRPRARRPQPRVLHLGRLRGGRVGLEALAPVPQAQRRAACAPRSSRARPPTTAPPSARSRSPGSRRCARPSSRSYRAPTTCPTPTTTAGPRTATRSGPPTRSST